MQRDDCDFNEGGPHTAWCDCEDESEEEPSLGGRPMQHEEIDRESTREHFEKQTAELERIFRRRLEDAVRDAGRFNETTQAAGPNPAFGRWMHDQR